MFKLSTNFWRSRRTYRARSHVCTYLHEQAYKYTQRIVRSSGTQSVCSKFLSIFQWTLLVHGLTNKLLQWIKGREYIKKKWQKKKKKTFWVVIRNKLSWYDKGILWGFSNLSHPFSQTENWTLDKQTAHEQIDWVIKGNSLRVKRYESACVLYLALNIQINDHNL